MGILHQCPAGWPMGAMDAFNAYTETALALLAMDYTRKLIGKADPAIDAAQARLQAQAVAQLAAFKTALST